MKPMFPEKLAAPLGGQRMRTWNVRSSNLFLAVLALVVILNAAAPDKLLAQASPAASKTSGLSVFGGFVRVAPDYGPQTDYGGIFGADYSRYVHWHFVPALEFRGKVTNLHTVSEKTFGGGIHLEYPIHKFHPYATFLISYGIIDFNPAIAPGGPQYPSDASVVYSYGAGIDYDITKRWAAKFDFQSEHWNLDPITLTPTAITFGGVFRF
jgi:hypothetical protein